MIKFILALVLLTSLGFVPSAQELEAARASLPSKFTRVTLGAGMAGPTAMVYVGNKILVTQKNGAIRIIRANGTLKKKPFHQLSVSTEEERGLVGIALDPDYAANGSIYVYYTTGPGAKQYNGTPENRVSRLKKTANGKIKEKIILDHIPSTGGMHNGGDIHFGFDAKLYVSVGDSYCCPGDAQKLDTLRGKILRINKDGTIPADNPFYNTPGARQETYALGFRNPWRFTKRASNQTYIVADVGAAKWEEVDSLAAGANYGWPLFEGPCPQTKPNCAPKKVDYGATTKPIHWYGHVPAPEYGPMIAGGIFAENSNYPAPFADAYFYADGGAQWVHVLTLDASNRVTGRYDFDKGVNFPVAFGRGPDGSVHVVAYGAGAIYKYVYTP
ncbi:MAG: PQQ-dependent sugar dehydrogenase [Anaerolineae bacterium]|nr:PQQ-dependent sugar dehydrogenase [Anaerolineae bacterium]